MYLYDLVDIKKKRVTHSRLKNSQVVQNRFFIKTNMRNRFCQAEKIEIK